MTSVTEARKEAISLKERELLNIVSEREELLKELYVRAVGIENNENGLHEFVKQYQLTRDSAGPDMMDIALPEKSANTPLTTSAYIPSTASAHAALTATPTTLATSMLVVDTAAMAPAAHSLTSAANLTNVKLEESSPLVNTTVPRVRLTISPTMMQAPPLPMPLKRKFSEVGRREKEKPYPFLAWNLKVEKEPLSSISNTSHKALCTRDWFALREELKYSRVHSRLEELKTLNLSSTKQIKKQKDPPRLKCHWDYLLDEMKWMSVDFRQERKWKVAMAKVIADAARLYVLAARKKDRMDVDSEEEEAGGARKKKKKGKPVKKEVEVKDEDEIMVEASVEAVVTEPVISGKDSVQAHLDSCTYSVTGSASASASANGGGGPVAVRLDMPTYGPPVFYEKDYVQPGDEREDRVVPVAKVLTMPMKYKEVNGWDRYGRVAAEVDEDDTKIKILQGDQRHDLEPLISPLFGSKDSSRKSLDVNYAYKGGASTGKGLVDWTTEEDEELVSAVKTYGPTWDLVSEHMNALRLHAYYQLRTAGECFTRWRAVKDKLPESSGRSKKEAAKQKMARMEVHKKRRFQVVFERMEAVSRNKSMKPNKPKRTFTPGSDSMKQLQTQLGWDSLTFRPPAELQFKREIEERKHKALMLDHRMALGARGSMLMNRPNMPLNAMGRMSRPLMGPAAGSAGLGRGAGVGLGLGRGAGGVGAMSGLTVQQQQQQQHQQQQMLLAGLTVQQRQMLMQQRMQANAQLNQLALAQNLGAVAAASVAAATAGHAIGVGGVGGGGNGSGSGSGSGGGDVDMETGTSSSGIGGGRASGGPKKKK